MKMMRLPLILGVVALVGCATPLRPPADVAHIQLERIDSPVVRVEKIWLERKKGPLVVTGYIIKRPESTDTTLTHLDVTLFNAEGQVLRDTVEHFEPKQIPRRYRRPDYATYRVTLDPLPIGTVRILVRAHEGNHS
ncbi:MAG: hypothetical protein SFY80_09015 [Verrucomicrobiota bacterium]|nr:hypothetical protein [Verrucomicrobiota bacterium]